MITCVICKTATATHSGVVNGTYYKHVCSACLTKKNRVSSGHARWSRTIDTEDHQADLMQPFNADGTLNVDFARMYPTQAEAIFTPEQLDRALRK